MKLQSFMTRTSYILKNKKFAAGVVFYYLFNKRPFNRAVNTGFYKKFYGKRINKVVHEIKTPLSIQIESTNICNADCVMCPRGNHTRKQNIMDMELFKKIVDEIASIDTIREVCLSGFGEPLIDKNLIEKIKYCKLKNPKWKTIIFTNGTYLNEDVGKQILESGLDIINFSFNGANKQIYEDTMKISYDVSKNNIDKFIEIKNSMVKKNPFVVISCVANNVNKKDLENFKEMWKGKADNVVIIEPDNWLSAPTVDEPLKGITKENTQAFPCKLLLHPIISWNGNLCMCCRDFDDFKVFGNLRESSFMELWNSDEYVNFRNRHFNYKLESICVKCDLPYKKNATSWWQPI